MKYLPLSLLVPTSGELLYLCQRDDWGTAALVGLITVFLIAVWGAFATAWDGRS